MSYSYISKFACPYAAFLRYQGGIKGPSSIHLVLGSALHFALEQCHSINEWELELATNIFKEELIRLVWAEEVPVGWPDIKKKEAEGIKMLELHDKQILGGTIPARPAAVEQEFRLQFESLEIVGKIDRVDWEGDDLIISDYKSGQKEPIQWSLDHNLQFTAYSWASQTLYGRIPDRLVWWHLRNGKRLVTHRTQADIDQLKTMVDAIVKKNDDGFRYRIFQDEICKWCDYQGPICDDPDLEQKILTEGRQSGNK
jgi:hypothetical protein